MTTIREVEKTIAAQERLTMALYLAIYEATGKRVNTATITEAATDLVRAMIEEGWTP